MPQIMPSTFCGGVGKRVHKIRTALGGAVGAELEHKGAWADLNWPEVV